MPIAKTVSRLKEPMGQRDKRILADNVKKYRELRRLTQAGLAKKAGITRVTLNQIENASPLSNPRYGIICTLAEALEVKTAALLDEKVLTPPDSKP